VSRHSDGRQVLCHKLVKQALELFEAALQGEDNTGVGLKQVRHRRKMDTPRKRVRASEDDFGTTPEESPETSQVNRYPVNDYAVFIGTVTFLLMANPGERRCNNI